MDRRAFLIACLALTGVSFSPAARAAAEDDRPIICIDPGHPSEINDGYQQQNGTTETHSDWVVALRLKKVLKSSGYKVVMTKKTEKQMVTNINRARVANAAHARLMVRLHCDSAPGNGYRIYYPDTSATDRGVTGPSADIQRKSRQAAMAMRDGMAALIKSGLKSNGVATDRDTYIGKKKGGALIGSIHSEIPVVLIEMVVLSNAKDAEFIKSPTGQESLAQGLAEGVRRYVPVKSAKR